MKCKLIKGENGRIEKFEWCGQEYCGKPFVRACDFHNLLWQFPTVEVIGEETEAIK